MEIKIGIAKTTKYGADFSVEVSDIAVRPTGGLTVLLAAGAQSGALSQRTATLAASKAAALVMDGAWDSAICREVHDYLYNLPEKKVACSLVGLSADTDTETVYISRSGSIPVIVSTADYDTVYDDETTQLGTVRHAKPLQYELPLTADMKLIAYTAGFQNAGKKRRGSSVEMEKIMKIISASKADEAEFLAKSLLEYALELDGGEASADMTVACMGIADTAGSAGSGVELFGATYPFVVKG